MSAPPVTVRRSGAGVLGAPRFAGAALLAATAWIHLELWNDGHRTVDVIGPAFLLAVIAGSGLVVVLAALAVLASGRRRD